MKTPRVVLAVLLATLGACGNKSQKPQPAPAAAPQQAKQKMAVAATRAQPEQLACNRTAASDFITSASDGDKASLMRVDEDGHLFYLMKHKAWLGTRPKTDPRFGTLAFALYTAEACVNGTVRQVDFFDWKGRHVAKVGPEGMATD